MIRIITLIMASIICDLAQAEQWSCNDNSSRLIDDGEVQVCGTSTDNTVETAKAWAFHEAHMEFWRMCMASSTCKGYEVSMTPGRMECTEKPYRGLIYKSRWTCKRSVTFTIDRSKRPCDENGKERFKGCPMNRMPFDGV